MLSQRAPSWMFSSPRSASIFVLTSFIYMMWLLQFLIICESCCIILLVFVKVACPMKTNVWHIVWSHIKICIFSWKGLYLLKQFQFIMQLLCEAILDLLVNMCFDSFVWEECIKAIDFSDRLLDVPLTYVQPYFVITTTFCNICTPLK